MINKKERYIKIAIISILLLVLIVIWLLIFFTKENNDLSNKEVIIPENNSIYNTNWQSTKMEVFNGEEKILENPVNLMKLKFNNKEIEICVGKENIECRYLDFTEKEENFSVDFIDLLNLQNVILQVNENGELVLSGKAIEQLDTKYYFIKDTEG